MKHLKHFNENNFDDVDFHIQEIEDVFLDVKDAFGLYKFVNMYQNGAFYNINRRTSDKIRLWIANISNGDDISINKEILHSQTLRDFETRLKNMGYTIKLNNHGKEVYYYDIIISWE